MTHLLVFKEYIRNIYQKYCLVFQPLFRFCIGFIVFHSINQFIGYNPTLDVWYVELVLAIVSVILPQAVLLFMAAVFVTVHVFYVVPLLAGFLAAVFLILYFIYLRFVPEHGYVILAMPVLYALHIPYGLPLLLGVISTPLSIIPLSCGVLVYQTLQIIISVISTSADDTVNLYNLVFQQVSGSTEMYVSILIFSLTTIFVYVLSSRKFDYVFDITIAVGAFLEMLAFMFAKFICDININLLSLIIGTVVSAAVVWIIQFFRLALNYAGVEHLQFEDDEYYYYVKAVPKMNITVRDIHVKHFNSHNVPENVTYLEEEGLQRISQEPSQEQEASQEQEREDSGENNGK